ncbi:acyloxyacyl hydrolase [Carboxylicivirga sp. M1479]|uniref:acyloxyacyl hydrolase n=1 Tax=Carboxylicivirga sp. M1479 TaxID=2594476 RepID=UPI001178420B|nr:acyloxyacyl hydrolase [Carboxylicivirga sp. M1479]TRX72436.1 acyloxyacyl hydrolase [Carboxylicivirga sp. M1479]
MSMPHHHRHLVVWLAILLFICQLGIGQTNQSESPTFYGLSIYYGQFQVHTKSLYPYNGTHPYGAELEISQLLLKDNIREKFGTFIKWGIGFNYVNFEHDDLGFAISSVAYVEPFIKTRGKWRYSIKLGGGIAYMSNPYDAISNPQNLTYSTNFAFPLYGGISIYHFINKQFAIKASASFQHISNGGIKQPNLGINYPVIAIATEFTNNSYIIPPRKRLSKFNKEKRIEVLLGYSAKEDTTNTNNQQVLTIIANRSWQVSRINSITGSILVEYQQNVIDPKLWSIAPLVGNEFIFGQLLFGQQIGAYVLKGSSASNTVLQNYYLRYKINSRLIAGVNLKAHGKVADYLSVQVGFIF